ncbi:MAG: hypothetical protein H6562_00180 [Lewinellaceae bacterium]|nr:hypothetical protein [Lewinella sp.]MCB9277301.1 hypothetical protein [Lewinellaceae bacterium]
MKIVVDTNIVFSAILNTNSKIGDLLMNSESIFEFRSVMYLKDEIEKHEEKLMTISSLSQVQIEQSIEQVFSCIKFISEEIIPFEVWQKALRLVRDVDIDDIAFVALSEYEGVKLWTGDKELITGLRLRDSRIVLPLKN